jgi:sugar lactone lactonase YvrE
MDGPRGVATFNNPVNVTVGADGTVYVADFDNSLVRAVTPDGTVTTLTQPNPDFFRPFGLAIGADGKLYVQTDEATSGERTGALWSVDLTTGELTLERDDIGRVRGIAALPDGRLVLADYQAHVLRVYNPSQGAVTILAGAEGQAGYADGAGAQARFDVPYDVVVLADGTLVVSDQGNNRLRQITVDGDVSTFAGTGDPSSADGTRMQASFDSPQALAVGDDGTLYVTDTGSYVIRRVSTSGMVTTVAGHGTPGFRDSSNPLQAQFFGLEGMAADGPYLYVADGSRGEPEPYHRVRRITLDGL